jgi:hypothetical protein
VIKMDGAKMSSGHNSGKRRFCLHFTSLSHDPPFASQPCSIPPVTLTKDPFFRASGLELVALFRVAPKVLRCAAASSEGGGRISSVRPFPFLRFQVFFYFCKVTREFFSCLFGVGFCCFMCLLFLRKIFSSSAAMTQQKRGGGWGTGPPV